VAEVSAIGKIRHFKKRAFLSAYSRCGSIQKAAKRAKVDRQSHYNWLRDDPDYVAAVEEAKTQGFDALEDMLNDAALDDRNITAAIFLLKANRPDKYKERSHMAVELPLTKRLIGVDIDDV
jgi:hypothetical protein